MNHAVRAGYDPDNLAKMERYHAVNTYGVSLVIGRDPTRAAHDVLNSRDPQMAMREIRATTRKTADVLTPAWNEKLAKLLRRANIGREAFGEDDE